MVGGKQWEPSAEGRWDQVVLGRAVSSESGFAGSCLRCEIY